jgi:hypothetical protein
MLAYTLASSGVPPKISLALLPLSVLLFVPFFDL